MADLSQPNNPFASNTDDHLSRLLAADVEAPWYRDFVQNIKDLFNPPKLPPLELTSKPVAVKDIWGLYGRQKKSFMMSFGFQALVAVLLFTILSTKAVQDKVKQIIPILLPPDAVVPVKPKSQGGGGGARSPIPASKGALPKPAPRQFVPPTAVINNTAPKLTMDMSILAPPDSLPNVNMPNIGNPLGRLGPPSNGNGSGGGIGNGKGGGVGNGTGGGFGNGSGGGVYTVGGGVTAPKPIYSPDPEYSEEARKAKYMGIVQVYIEVDPSGNVINPRVTVSKGMGLDEKALEAVRKWKFKPGLKDGKPVTVSATVEINFRLL